MLATVPFEGKYIGIHKGVIALGAVNINTLF
jgi:hypothetical protein